MNIWILLLSIAAIACSILLIFALALSSKISQEESDGDYQEVAPDRLNLQIAPKGDRLWYLDLDNFSHYDLFAIRASKHKTSGVWVIALVFLSLRLNFITKTGILRGKQE